MRIPSPMPSGPATRGPSWAIPGSGVMGPSELLSSAPSLGRNDGRAGYHYIRQEITAETFDKRSHVRERTPKERCVRKTRGWIVTHAVGAVAAAE